MLSRHGKLYPSAKRKEIKRTEWLWKTWVEAAQRFAQAPRQHGDDGFHQVGAGASERSFLVQGAPPGDEVGHVRDVHAHPEAAVWKLAYGQGII